MYDIHTMLPCKVLKYDGKVADIKPLVYQYKELPVITSVPVLFFGNKQVQILFDTKPGDIVFALFSQLDVARLVALGESGEVDSTERFNLTNCVALPFSFTNMTEPAKIPLGDFTIKGDVHIVGSLKVNGIDFITHVHGGVTPGSGVTLPPGGGL